MAATQTGFLSSSLNGFTFVAQSVPGVHGTKLWSQPVDHSTWQKYYVAKGAAEIIALSPTANQNLLVSYPRDPSTNFTTPQPPGGQLTLRDVTHTRWTITPTKTSTNDYTDVLIQSQHPISYVVDVKWKNEAKDTDVIGWYVKPDDLINQTWTFSKSNRQQSLLISKLNGLALSVRTTPQDDAQLETAVIGANSNQLWSWSPYGFLHLSTAPHLVLALPLLSNNTPRPSSYKNESTLVLEDLSLSLWREALSSNITLKWYQLIHPAGYVIDVSDYNKAPKTCIIGWWKKAEKDSINQLWALEAADDQSGDNTTTNADKQPTI